MKKTKQPPAADKVQTKTNKMLVSVILDRSGSMGTTRDGTISGYNEYIQGLRADKDGEYSVSLTQFDAPLAAPELTVSYEDRALADVPDLSKETYQPRGNTPLYDAIGEVVRRTEGKGRGVMCLIITDGQENASTEFTKETVKALIKQKESEGWVFTFLGANIDSFAVGGSIGISAATCANYAPGQEKHLYSALARSTVSASLGMRSFGVGSRQMRAAAAPTTRERSAMLGGRPAAPPPFRPPTPPSAPAATKPTRRQWTVRSEVSGT